MWSGKPVAAVDKSQNKPEPGLTAQQDRAHELGDSMTDNIREYREAVDDLLAATIHETEMRLALSAACDEEVRGDFFKSAIAQQKRLAVYAATEAREEAAQRYVIRWERIGKRHPAEVSA